MRGYDSHGRTIVTVTVGESAITIQRGSGAIDHANIIYAERDATGRIVYAMLDRKVHGPGTNYGEWTMTGCFSTEMRRDRAVSEAERDAADTLGWVVDRVRSALPDGADGGLAAEIAEHIVEASAVVGFWQRIVLLDELRGWIVQRLDAADLGDLDELEGVAERIIGLCKEGLA